MRKVLWIGGILLVGIFVWGMSYVLTPDNGDAEFQKMLEATEQVKSFRGLYVGSTQTNQHAEKLWELDCNRRILHKQTQELPTGANTLELKEDQFLVGADQKFTRNSYGSWDQTKYTSVQYSASWYCDNLAQGTLRDLLPDFRAMLRSATFGKAEKKTVNGLRCQDWSFTMHSRESGQRGSLCIGLEDHLPYEMITVDSGGHYSYSDYNRPIQFEASESILQSASATGSN